MGLALIITYSSRAYCQLRPADVEEPAEDVMADVSRMGVPASVTARQAPLENSSVGAILCDTP